ncbi:MAG TPA: hypothetical protein VHT51_09020 [Micropepsaceae bacterium]|jgi:hypothetical protein|nr:hypothetical protein [Micropepsaceae bacterium]
MKKIPVAQTIAFAYRFLVTEIGTIVGIAWLPAVLSSAMSYLARFYEIQNRALIDAGDAQARGVYLLLSLASLMVVLFASSMVAVAITRAALGRERPPGTVLLYFAAGPSERRMFAANTRYLLGAGVLLGLALLISFAALFLSGTPLDAPEQVRPTPATILAVLIVWAAFLYAGASIVRMGFMLPPTVVMEEKGGLKRSHELTKGNFWRVLAIMLVLGGPFVLLLLGGEAVVLRSALGPDFLRTNPAEFFQKADEAMDAKLLPWQIFSAIIFVLASGLIYSGAAFAYRSVTQPENARRLDVEA